jgi:O-succinylbenzoate synthase
MRQEKPVIPDFGAEGVAEQREARQLALEYLAEAWNTAEDEGVESIALAHASLFAALATLVRTHGEEATAMLVAGLPDRIRSGEYDLERQTH